MTVADWIAQTLQRYKDGRPPVSLPEMKVRFICYGCGGELDIKEQALVENALVVTIEDCRGCYDHAYTQGQEDAD